MDLVPINVKVLSDGVHERLVINGYKLDNLVDPITQEDEVIDESNEKVIDEFQTDELIISSSLDYADTIDERINGLGSLGFRVYVPYGRKYMNFILHNIPWFPSFSVGALSFDEPILAARCVPRLFYDTQALELLGWTISWPPHSTFETTRDWICAEPYYDTYVSFHLAEFINGMQNIMGKTYKDFLEQDVQ